MNAHEFKEARINLGLSQSQLGKIIDTDPRTVRRWENDERPPNPIACRVLKWMLKGFDPSQYEDAM